MRKLTSFATATAIVLTSLAAVPAEARQRHYGGWGYRDRDHISTGEVIGGLLVLGTIAAIVGSASKDKAERRNDRYDPPYREPRQDAPNYEPQRDEAEPYGSGTTEVRPYGKGEAEARASDACSWAVESEMGDDSRVDSITKTEPNNGGWYVTGTASRLGGDVRSFGCSFANGRVVDVRFN
ncbi:hypothetical protein [Sphingopyxis sp.]|uniref:hypothetical protein n=1 Tax=Sphingopyxis sp. TaxID=1908224 RepID=UPI003BA97844